MVAILRTLFYFFIRTFRYILFCKKFIDSLAVEMYELRSKREDVERDVTRARRAEMELKSQVIWWLDRVQALENKFAEASREFERRFMLPGSVALNFWSSYQISMKADEMIAEACYLKSKGSFNEVAIKPTIPNRFEEVPSLQTVGMDSALAQLQQAVEDDTVGIIGIHGMGGIGKTALLSRFNNEFLNDAIDLDVVIFIDSCRDLDVEIMQKRIRDRLGLSWKNRKTVKEKAAYLYRVLCKMKFLLILDDVWKPVDLQIVGIPIPKQGSKCKIVIATRIEGLCDMIDAKKKIKVGTLSWEMAWKLFTEKVGEETISSHPGIRHQAEILAKKCGGLPLALIAVARALASKRSPDEWKHGVTIMNRDPAQLPGITENVLFPLKRSYDHLPNGILRSCALHFALYWEGCRVHKNLVQEYWIGEGILDDFKDMEEANNKACYLLGILSSFSLIERVDASGYTKMHPMIRAMVLWIACECGERENKWLVAEREELSDAPDGEIWRGAERLALGYNNFTVLPESPECPNLVCLKLKNNLSLEKIPDGFFRFMPSLVVLDLHSTSVKDVPPGIGNLIGLQFLELYGTKLKSLPREMGNLKKLKYLGLNWTIDLATIPDGLIQSLANLRALRMIVSYSAWKAGSAGDGVDFDELEGLKRLRILDITIGTATALKKLSRSRRLAPATVALLIKGGQGLTTIELPSILGRNMRSLKWLRISHSTELEEVVIGNSRGEAALLPEPENLVLEFLSKARIVMRSHSIEHLRGLYLYGCDGMEQLVYYKDGEEAAMEGAAAAPFPNLKEIALRGLPELKRVTDETRALVFPALESMEVEKCAKLRKLNLVAEKLREIKCERSWWDQLEWEDEATSSAFGSLLKPLRF